MDTILLALGLKDESEVTKEHLLELYWLVSRCTENYGLAVLHNMTVEKALNLLREVRDHAWKVKQFRLSGDAHDLLWQIVENQEGPSDEDLENMTCIGVDLEYVIDQPALIVGAKGA